MRRQGSLLIASVLVILACCGRTGLASRVGGEGGTSVLDGVTATGGVAATGGAMAVDSNQRGGFCGDGVVQPEYGEECDDGILDGSYGGCTPACRLAPCCGDGILNGPEECDHGADNTQDGRCSSSCRNILYGCAGGGC